MLNLIEGSSGKFNKSFVRPFEHLSVVTRAYEITARSMADRLVEYNTDPTVVGEIGSGTGNSSTVFLERLPTIRSLICLEPDAFIWTASDKLRGVQDVNRLGEEAQYMHEMSNRLRPFTRKIHFVQGRSPVKEEDGALPLVDESLDAVLCCQSFHWLDSQRALSNFRRVLKAEGTLSLDESGYQVDLGDEINNLHVTKHPLFVYFQKVLQEILFEKKLVENREPVQPKFLFTPDSLKKLVETYGFELIREGNSLFKLTIVPYNRDQVKAVTYDGARMRIARLYPGIDPEEADIMISRAKEKTELFEFKENIEGEYAETFANFLFKRQT